jgi:ribosomal protein L11 methyltransferase
VAKIAQEFVQLPVRITDPVRAEVIAAEAMEEGAQGLEERDLPQGVTELIFYVTAEDEAHLRASIEPWLQTEKGDRLLASEPIPETDWTTSWQQGLTATEISPRLVIRPSFVEHTPAPGQACLIIDPGQAFGTGTHSSTFLALACLCALPAEELRGHDVLDVGAGTGILAMAAVALGAASALGFDLDPLAEEAALINAEVNGLSGETSFFTGPMEELPAGKSFQGILANMLRSEVLPLVPEIGRRVAAGGWVIFSGLLESDLSLMEPALAKAGLELESSQERVDTNGDRWVGICTRRKP